MASLTHRLEESGNGSTLYFDGEIDLSNSKSVRVVILGALDNTQSLAVDLSKVSYMDSSGIANLIEGLQRARSSSKSFRVCEVSEPVRMVLRMAQLEKILVA